MYRPSIPKLQGQDLEGKVAIVTGATKGIGRAISIDFATRGCSVLGTYSSPQSTDHFDTLYKTVTDLYNSNSSLDTPKLKGIAADITSIPNTNHITETIEKDFGGRLDILVLNASYNAMPKLGTASGADIVKTLTGNLQFPITLMEQLVASKFFNPNSRVVIISSDRLRAPVPGFSLYNVSKAGLEALARTWALELPLSFPGTTVNAVSVGFTDTDHVRAMPAERREMVKKEWLPKVKVVEGGRVGHVEDIADVVGWLVSEKSRWTTGSVVAANGGSEFIGGSH